MNTKKFYKENEGWFINEKPVTVYFTKNESFWVFGMYLNTMCFYEKKCHNWHEPDYFCKCLNEAFHDYKESNVDCAYID